MSNPVRSVIEVHYGITLSTIKKLFKKGLNSPSFLPPTAPLGHHPLYTLTHNLSDEFQTTFSEVLLEMDIWNIYLVFCEVFHLIWGLHILCTQQIFAILCHLGTDIK